MYLYLSGVKDMEVNRNKDKTATITGYVVGGIILLVVGFFLFASMLDKSPQADGPMTKNAAEQACQDEAVIKMQGTGVSVVSLMNYNPQFYKTGDTADDGTDIYQLFWNGKTKDGENSSQFVCYVSGTEQNIHIESLQYGATRLD